MTKGFLIIGFIVAIVGLVYKFGYADPKAAGKNQIKSNDLSQNQKDNDKIVIVKKIALDYLKKAIQQYCDIYNKQRIIARPKLTVLESQYLITFPYDIDFENFCYFINYLKYANELCLKPDYKPEIIAWCSTRKGDSWMIESLINKHVMLFIPDWDKDYDNVYLTTEYNLGFKMGFALGESHIKLDKPILDFKNPPIDILKISGTQTIDFQ